MIFFFFYIITGSQYATYVTKNKVLLYNTISSSGYILHSYLHKVLDKIQMSKQELNTDVCVHILSYV